MFQFLGKEVEKMIAFLEEKCKTTPKKEEFS